MKGNGTESLEIMALAITRSGGHSACVGGVTPEDTWIRPEPLFRSDVERLDCPFRYFCWTPIELRRPDKPARPEDRVILAPPRQPRQSNVNRLTFLERLCDGEVEEAFSQQRSLGLIEVKVEAFSVKRALGGKSVLRASFRDRSGRTFDWIVPEVALVDWAFKETGRPREAAPRLSALAERFSHLRVFFAIGLTLPRTRFPGPFRDCQPLVVGIHTVPGYREEARLPEVPA